MSFTTALLPLILAIGYQWALDTFWCSLKAIPLIILFLVQIMFSCCDLCQISQYLQLHHPFCSCNVGQTRLLSVFPTEVPVWPAAREDVICRSQAASRPTWMAPGVLLRWVEKMLPELVRLLCLPQVSIQELPFHLCYSWIIHFDSMILVINSSGHDRAFLCICAVAKALIKASGK